MKVVLLALCGIIIGVAGISYMPAKIQKAAVVVDPVHSYYETIPVEHIEFEPLHIDAYDVDDYEDVYDSDAYIPPCNN